MPQHANQGQVIMCKMFPMLRSNGDLVGSNDPLKNEPPGLARPGGSFLRNQAQSA
jgi:hypothetical protein